MPKASEVAAELSRTYRANESRLEAIKKLNPSPLLASLYAEVENVLQENSIALRLAIGALEAPASAQVGVAFGGFDGDSSDEAQIGAPEDATEAAEVGAA